jgi:predicted site-specific integrase-resolvase
MSKLVSISAASRVLGVSQITLRRWECSGRLVPHRTAAGHRRYDLSKITAGSPSFRADQRKTVAYARVSSSDQQADLERQKQVLEIYCAQQGWRFEIISDLGSGMNDHKKVLNSSLKTL